MERDDFWQDHCDDFEFIVEPTETPGKAKLSLVRCDEDDTEIHFHYVSGDNLVELRDVIDRIIQADPRRQAERKGIE